MKAVRWLENAILGLVFADTVCYKSINLLIFEAEVLEKDKLSHPESTIRPTLVRAEEKFSK